MKSLNNIYLICTYEICISFYHINSIDNKKHFYKLGG